MGPHGRHTAHESTSSKEVPHEPPHRPHFDPIRGAPATTEGREELGQDAEEEVRKKIDEQLLPALWPRRPNPQVEDRAPDISPMMSHPGKATTLNPGRLHLGKAEGQISNNEFEGPIAM